mgnify:CR=1 FL=1
MLLLHRHQNESIVIHKDDEPDKAIVVRVTEVLPTGDVTLGFMGDGYTVVRQEIFGKPPKARTTKYKEKDDYEYKRTYYS